MSNLALRNVIPSGIAVLLSPKLQHEIVSAAYRAEQRITHREQRAENAARHLQWIAGEVERHELGGCQADSCSELRALRRRLQKARGYYQSALDALRKAR